MGGRWETIRAFKDINYDGVLSVEYACGSMAEQGAPLVEDFINLPFKAAQYVWTV